MWAGCSGELGQEGNQMEAIIWNPRKENRHSCVEPQAALEVCMKDIEPFQIQGDGGNKGDTVANVAEPVQHIG